MEDLRERVLDFGGPEGRMSGAGVAGDVLPNAGLVSPASGTPLGTLSLALDLQLMPPLELGTSLLDAEIIEDCVESGIFIITRFRCVLDIRGRIAVPRGPGGSGGRVRRHTTTTATALTFALSSPTHTPPKIERRMRPASEVEKVLPPA